MKILIGLLRFDIVNCSRDATSCDRDRTRQYVEKLIRRNIVSSPTNITSPYVRPASGSESQTEYNQLVSDALNLLFAKELSHQSRRRERQQYFHSATTGTRQYLSN